MKEYVFFVKLTKYICIHVTLQSVLTANVLRAHLKIFMS